MQNKKADIGCRTAGILFTFSYLLKTERCSEIPFLRGNFDDRFKHICVC